MNTKIIFLLLVFSISFASCNDTSKPEKSEDNKNMKQKNIEVNKTNSMFINTTWLLESINGEKVVYPADYKQNFIIFTSEAEGFKFSGFAGCNNILGKYDVGDHGEIGIENVASTRKMCSFMELENNYIKMLKEITSYKIDGHLMTVFSGDKLIATFKDAKELSTH